ncbi:HNH endonuclease [Nocardioides exalbidus]|uniref:HNH endonuclease n=1 Tax=Nocardioides exalbidus TaxID=402596 RepID=UPI000B83CD84|nr:HNH endonuclease signature motif containing protein [Nocardioides exalbidus]
MSYASTYSAEFIDWARSQPMSARARKALEFMLEHGSVTTGDLKAAGYDHPPRAVRDVKDAGLMVESKLVNVGGTRMSRYTLLDTMSEGFVQRRPISNAFRNALFDQHDHRCAVCGEKFITRMLQADHRVPFAIGGDPAPELQHYMPLCGSDNRAKSMSCENCPNWSVRDVDTCKTCYWHDPAHYSHVATVDERRLAITARGMDVANFDQLAEEAAQQGLTFGEYLLEVIDGLTQPR